MKAIILCGEGEEGLAPLTLERPLPLLSLFDKPLLAHQAGLLRRHGVREIGVALPRLSRMVEDAMGDGEELGVRFTWLPCRGAGELELLAACAGFLGEEDALVLPGGGLGDLDLSALLAFHQVHRSAATLALAHRPPAAGRALVFSDGEGRVERLLDAPAGRLLASQVETGVCILTAAARAGAAGEGTLAGRLSALLDRGEALYGVVPEGQWRELTGGEAYLDALADALSGKLRLRWDAPRTAPGVWSASPLPPSVQVVPPCYIGPGVQVGEGSLLGPHTVLEGGSTVGRRALVQRSALLGAAAEERTTLYGAVLCPGAAARAGAVLNEGALLADRAEAGEDAILLERVAVWPGRRVPAGARLTASLTAGGLKPPLAFGGGGTLEGAIGAELTAETLLVLGGLLGREGTVGLGWAGGAGRGCWPRPPGAARPPQEAGCSLTTRPVPPPPRGWRRAGACRCPFLSSRRGSGPGSTSLTAGACPWAGRGSAGWRGPCCAVSCGGCPPGGWASGSPSPASARPMPPMRPSGPR
ncbi:MAG: sugar phosphate nucleotidyltransferase [Flavonifractor plautii]